MKKCICSLILIVFLFHVSLAYASSPRIAIGSNNGYLFVYDAEGALLWRHSLGSEVFAADISDDGKYIAEGGNNGFSLFSADGSILVSRPEYHVSDSGQSDGKGCQSIQMSSDGQLIAIACTDSLKVIDSSGAEIISHSGQKTCAAISSNGQYVVACNKLNNDVCFFNKSSPSYPAWTKSIQAFWVSVGDNGCAAVASIGGTVYVYNLSGTEQFNYTHPKWSQSYLRTAMSRDGTRVIAGNDDHENNYGSILCYWDASSSWNSSPDWTYDAFPGINRSDIYAVDISPDGSTIAAGGSPAADGSFVLNNSGTKLQTLNFGNPQDFDFLPDGQFGICGNKQDQIYYFSKNTSSPLWYRVGVSQVRSVAIGNYTDDWPMFMHDVAHKANSTSSAPASAKLLWTFETGGAVYSSAAMVDGRVYIGSQDNKLYCLNANTGGKIWEYSTMGGIGNSPAVHEGRIYFGSADTYVYCVNTNGILQWKIALNGPVTVSPTVNYDKIYVATTPSAPLIPSIYALKVFPDSPPGGQVAWEYSYTPGGWISSPAVLDNKLYIGVSGGGDYGYAALCCLNAGTGDLINKVTLGDLNFIVSPLVNSLSYRLYVGGVRPTGAGNFSTFYCLNTYNSSLSTVWSKEFWGGTSESAFYEDKVYVGKMDGYFFCYRAGDGSELWRYETKHRFDTGPVVAGGKVYFGANAGTTSYIYCLNAVTGALIWRYETEVPITSHALALADNRIIFTAGNKVYCLGPDPDGDIDFDGIPNGQDNCPSIANPIQTDSNNNGLGDKCECTGTTLDGIDPIDMGDLTIFASYWLEPDPNMLLIDPGKKADYYRDFIVNNLDFRVLSDNWLANCPPIPPVNVSIADSNANPVQLNWDDNTENDISLYRIYRIDEDDPYNTDFELLADNISLSQYNDNTVLSGHFYRYYIAAVDLQGNESEPSMIVWAMP